GRYYSKESAFYLQYEELAEEGNTRTIVKVADGEALILRSGAVKMRMPFLLNKRQKGSYEIAAGALETESRATRIDHTYNSLQNSGKIELLYEMKVQGAKTGTYHLEIMFEEEKK
ncbi:MAG: DUF1934 family protein, partial [Bacillota bacterium]|nr:DUF1934 family protein [Bacillota bacterium]